MTDPHPRVAGFCPSCGGESLFLGTGGYVTCSRLDCERPDAATALLERRGKGAARPEVVNVVIRDDPPAPQLIPVRMRCRRCGA